ncbi:sigma-54-dependent Fis family transcriptional regulator [Geobacillus sp. Y412MC52]|uniref:sigma-54-dependent Fis family transcriptional regulator n=1 Tax=Geobacillus sp. (strain Y412MC52) TaxID=550542 RepID=UPI00018C151F|nr:sigma-54-dependent Fis family transcriptional regulator [Geobacillus sp. Y412MC52]ADU95965.1 proprionate catabolism activator, Fis family [Geobacillus sp. Y412MC52]
MFTYSKLTRILQEVLAEKQWPAEFILHEVLIEEAIKKAHEIEKTNSADVIVASGANATAIEEQGLSIPVVRIKVTGFDLVNALWLAKRMNRQAVVMSYQEPIPQLEQFRDLFRVDLMQEAYDGVHDAQEKLLRILGSGKSVIIGASLVNELTERMGGHSIFIYSRSSIRLALETAVELADQRRSEIEKRQKIQAMMRAVHEGILYVDTNGLLMEINPVAEKLLGVSAQDVIGKSIDKVAPEIKLDDVFKRGKPLLNVAQKTKQGMLLVNRIPVVHQGELIGAVATIQDAQAVQKAEKAIRHRVYSKGLLAKATFEHIIGKNSTFMKLIDKAQHYAQTDATILIRGETGTGKELFAQSIHNASNRNRHPFVAVNCAALPESILESELFGYEEGAFTGARKGGKQGLFELAHRGTIFLDEIGEMSLPLQSRLLRVLQEKEVMRLGSDMVIPIDVRIIAATNRDLKSMVKDGLFRQDLYYRLNVLSIELPPLRERLDDLPDLFRFFLKNYKLDKQLIEKVLSIMLPVLCHHNWPGNIRELENIAERVSVLLKAHVTMDEVLAEVKKELFGSHIEILDSTDLTKEVENWERQRILQVLREVRGSKTKAAALLGISRTTLWRKIKDYGIDRYDDEEKSNNLFQK